MLARPGPGGDTARRRTTEDLEWLRALAHRIASSQAEADDLVQEAWLTAEHSEGQARSRRAWLGGVLRNRERMRRRSEARRRLRETRAATTAEPPDPDLELHRRRVLAAMREALDELDDSDRQLLLARYCDEHDARALSERLGIPASTVRSRLSRATARVRRSLDERWGGDRRAWAPAILAAPLPARPSGPASFGWRALLMAGLGKKLWITLAVVLCATAWWVVSRDDDGGSTEGTALAAEEPVPATGPRTVLEADPIDATRATLGGAVLQAGSDQPLTGAVVLVTPARGPDVVLRKRGFPALTPRVITSPDGSFTMGDLPPGRYRVTAAKDGFLPARHGVVELAAGAERRDLTLRLSPGGNLVEGVVTDIGGGVVEGALVRASHRPDDSGARYGAVTDEDGRYRLTVPDGAWRITAGGEDYTPQHRKIHLDHGPGRADFVLVPGAAIHGQVLARATGEPVANAMVGFRFAAHRRGEVGNRSSLQAEMVRTDAAGGFRMHPLAPGVYELFASAEGMATVALVEVHAAIGEEVSKVELLADPASDIRGRVVDAADPEAGVAGVEVAVSAAAGIQQSFTTTTSDGTFRLSGLLPGGYLVNLTGPRVIPAYMRPLDVTGPDQDEVVFELAVGTTIRGRVEPAATGRVKLTLSTPPERFEDFILKEKLINANAAIQEDGSFSIDTVPTGTWTVVADADDGTRGELVFTAGEGNLDDLTVHLQPVEPSSTVEGRLLDGAGSPVAGVEVALKGEASSEAVAGVSAADGRFVVRDVEPGEYQLKLEDSKSRSVSVVGGSPAVVVKAGRTTGGLELRVELPHARIEGLVHDPTGVPLPDAWVTAVPSTDGHVVIEDQDATLITDADGLFAFEDLNPGDYDLFVRGPDADTRGHARGVSTDAAPVRIELEPLGEIRGTVTLRGAPVTRFVLYGGYVLPRTVISDEGSFALHRVEPGRQMVVVSNAEGSASAEFTVESGRTETVELELQPWGAVHGVLVSAVDGEPLAGMRIDVLSSGGMANSDASVMGALTGEGGPRSDAEGRFSVDGIGAGNGELRIYAGSLLENNQMLGRRPLTLTLGKTLDLGTVAILPPSTLEDDERGWLGLDSAFAERPSNPHGLVASHEAMVAGVPRRLWVTGLQPGGPAATAGVQVGDLVTAIDGMSHEEVGYGTLSLALDKGRIRAGQRYELRMERDGAAHTIAVEASARPKGI